MYLRLGVAVLGLLVLTVMSLSGAGRCSTDEPLTVKVMPLNSDIVLPQEERQRLEDAAIDGSVDAADRVLLHSTQQSDREALTYWAHIAAENGSVAGQQLLAILLDQSPETRDKRRAAYWRGRVNERKR
jgi:hypothetical protein